MGRVKKAENINITTGAETFIIDVCGKSVHTLLSYLEKFKLLEEKITSELAKRTCTNINHHDLATYTNAIFRELDLAKAIETIGRINEEGYSVIDILDNYFQFVKITDILLERQKYEIIKRVCKYIAYFYVGHEEDLELSLFTYELYELAV
jgi:DNA polymerase III gamma/tau subunit